MPVSRTPLPPMPARTVQIPMAGPTFYMGQKPPMPPTPMQHISRPPIPPALLTVPMQTINRQVKFQYQGQPGQPSHPSHPVILCNPDVINLNASQPLGSAKAQSLSKSASMPKVRLLLNSN